MDFGAHFNGLFRDQVSCSLLEVISLFDEVGYLVWCALYKLLHVHGEPLLASQIWKCETHLYECRLLLNIRGILEPSYGTKSFNLSTFNARAPPRMQQNRSELDTYSVQRPREFGEEVELTEMMDTGANQSITTEWWNRIDWGYFFILSIDCWSSDV